MKNFTAHEITLFQNGEVVARVAPSGYVARIINQRIQVEDTEGVPTCVLKPTGLGLIARDDFMKKTDNPEILPFPEFEEGVVYLVSSMILDAIPDRSDLRAPDTDASITDANGRIIGVPGFIRK